MHSYAQTSLPPVIERCRVRIGTHARCRSANGSLHLYCYINTATQQGAGCAPNFFRHAARMIIEWKF
jgi:hypothetical protein